MAAPYPVPTSGNARRRLVDLVLERRWRGAQGDCVVTGLRFDFPGYGGDGLREVAWAEWFDRFDKRRLNFIYQEERSDGSPSNFFRLESPDREDG